MNNRCTQISFGINILGINLFDELAENRGSNYGRITPINNNSVKIIYSILKKTYTRRFKNSSAKINENKKLLLRYLRLHLPLYLFLTFISLPWH